MSEQWTREFCKCGAENMVYLGRDDDITAIDYGGFKCWQCQGETEFPGYREEFLQEDEEIYFSEGERRHVQ